MIHGKNVLGILPARSGSKGVKNKNIREVAGQPLLYWTIKAARNSDFIDRIVLSTDCEEIAETARFFNLDVPFKRPDKIATDDASSVDVVLHVLEKIEDYDLGVLLQPTSPLRIAKDIDNCLKIMSDKNTESCITVTQVDHHPREMFRTKNSEKLEPFMDEFPEDKRRQERENLYAPNGAVYAFDCISFTKKKTFFPSDTLGYDMPKARSIDIDTPLDLKMADFLLRDRRCNDE